MSTAAGITVGVGNIGNQLLYIYKCINSIFYFLEKQVKQSLGPEWDGYLFGEKNENYLYSFNCCRINFFELKPQLVLVWPSAEWNSKAEKYILIYMECSRDF